MSTVDYPKFVVILYGGTSRILQTLDYDNGQEPERIIRDVRGYIDQSKELREQCTSVRLMEVREVAYKLVSTTKSGVLILHDQS